jgi:hypothetical protein
LVSPHVEQACCATHTGRVDASWHRIAMLLQETRLSRGKGPRW